MNLTKFSCCEIEFRIWEEFSRMVEQNKKTIVITTHYIEEATNADCVSFYFVPKTCFNNIKLNYN